MDKQKKSPFFGAFFVAEREGFEPPEVLPSTVFKTAAIDHSAISPGAKVQKKVFYATKIIAISTYFEL